LYLSRKNSQNIDLLEVLYSKETSSGGFVWVNTYNDSEAKLFSKCKLNDEEKALLASITVAQRRIDFLAVRYFIQQLLGENERIGYTPKGKPFLCSSGYKISLSHSDKLQAIYLHPHHELGIDLQVYTPKIKTISSRFLGEAEKTVAGDSLSKAIQYWCAKEALFKWDGDGNLTFSTQLLVDAFDNEEEGSTHGYVIRGGVPPKKVKLAYRKLLNCMLVYTLGEV
jgi:4'-phosphopantetheinyl transferase